MLGCAAVAAIAIAGFSSTPRPSGLAVVFGNAVTGDGRPSPRLRARLDAALALYRRGAVHSILVSGGVEQPGSRDEAAIMAAYLEAEGVPALVIVQDPAGVDTFETARHTANMAASAAGVVVVTQWFHIPRAMLAMRRFGVSQVSGDWPRWFEIRDIFSLLREAVAVPYYAVRSLGEPGAVVTAPTGSRRPLP